ncbi:MAG TPA: DUF4150 domain-containing protein [Nannocystaceae bacterium]|nr:DUF4150 domain-containing protein [Nannocystaceae bacterium]
MSQATFANARGIVHQGSGGQSIVFPDVCNTPTSAGPMPIPYPNIGQASDTVGGPATITTDGSMPMTKGAQYAKSSGDEAGTAGGLMSGRNMGPCEFLLYSFDVMLEGQGVCRLGDMLLHNGKNAVG